ncbi:MAG: lipoyl(octanoyl) transferase LipB [bacterium]|jgi:lipoyl(octanoyl) transferase|nr:lipoyl(octanoyl) transferase LipB [Betaproteobacteria bacterium]
MDIQIPDVGEDAAGTAPRVRRLGRTDYRDTWSAMQAFTDARNAGTCDELWLTEHTPVYTLGLAGRAVHLHPSAAGGSIDIVHSDRGGQVTYHGPGQVVMYVLLDLRRRHLGVRQLVRLLEQAVIDCLAESGVAALGRDDAPGVYVGAEKVAALGLKVRRGASYHGLALNVEMDLSPFAAIDPCGFPGLAVTQTRLLGIERTADELAGRLAELFITRLQAHFPIVPE